MPTFPADLLAGAALAGFAVAVRRVLARPRTPRDRLDALGPLPPHWRPVPRTVVHSHHLTGGRSW
jgi:hypothetical protein